MSERECFDCGMGTYDPDRERVIPNDGSVVVLEREDVIGAADCVAAIALWYRHRRDPVPEDLRKAGARDELAERLRSALEQAPEGESDG